MRGSLAVLSTVLGLELLLQLLALVFWMGGGPSEAAEHLAAEVVCVGDSYTFGMGASGPEGAYPSQLAALLSEQLGREVVVRNLGRPGSDSRDVLERTGLAMASGPRALCVLVGVNDRWRHPEPVAELDLGDPAAGAARFEWKLRSVELIRILARGRGAFDGDVDDVTSLGVHAVAGDAQDLLGGWMLAPGDVPVVFAANGSCWIGGADLAWHVAEGRLLVGAPRDPGARMLEPVAAESRSFRVERHAAGWTLTDASGVASALVPREDDATAEAERQLLLRHAEIAIFEGRTDEFREPLIALAGDPACTGAQQAKALELLVSIEVAKAGAAERITEQLRRLEAVATAHDDVAVESSLVRALMHAGRYEAAYQRVERRVAQSGSVHPALRLAQARAASQARTREEVTRILATLLADPDCTPELRRGAWQIQLSVSETQDQQVDVLVRAAAEDREPGGMLATEFQRRRTWLDETTIEAAAGRLGVEAEPALERLRELAAADGEADWKAVLTRHLERLHAVCSERGVALVVLTYPFEIRELQETLRAFAAQSGVRLAEMRTAFPTAKPEREPLFAPDGHCNDAGYALMARTVAAEIAVVLGD